VHAYIKLILNIASVPLTGGDKHRIVR